MPTDEQVRLLAYSIWEKEGCPDGRDVEHYYLAQHMLEEKESASSSSRETAPPPTPVKTPSPPRPTDARTGRHRGKKHR